MTKRPANQHPALATNKDVSPFGADDLEVAQLFHTEQWADVEGNAKTFLLHYIKYRDVRRAAEEMGPDSEASMEWFNYQEKNDRSFAWCIQKIVDHPKEVAQHIMSEALCESAFILVELMRNPNPRVQLDAIKQLHSVAAMGGAGLMEGAAQYMNVQINMDAFTGKPDNGKVIDGN